MSSEITSESFRKLLAAIGSDVAPSSPSSVDFLFEDDLPARLTLHPNGQEVVADVFAYDAATLDGDVQGIVLDTLLRLNAFGIRGRFFAVGIDPRGLIAVTTRAPMASLDDAGIAEFLDYAAGQARRLRDLVSSFVPTEFTHDYSLIQQDA